VERRHLQGCSPRLCRLKTDELAPRASIERTDRIWLYGSSKLISWLSTEAYIFLTASLAVVGEKVDMDPRIRWSSSSGLYREPFFSGAVGLYKSVDDFTKDCYVLTA
jgi:hypothetical protein